MRKQPIRFITSKEVKELLDIHIRRAQRLLKRVRKHFGKLGGQPITVEEFCSYTGLETAVVYEFLQKPPDQ